MDGLEFLEKVMRAQAVPGVMVIEPHARGATATIRAMELGAVDCIGKPSIDHPNSSTDLPARVRAAAGRAAAAPQPRAAGAVENSRPPTSPTPNRAIRRFDRGVEALNCGDRPRYPEPTARRPQCRALCPSPFTRSFAPAARRADGGPCRRAEDGADRVGRVYFFGARAASPISRSPAAPIRAVGAQQRRAGMATVPLGRRDVRFDRQGLRLRAVGRSS